MTESSNLQIETTVQMDATAFGADMEFPYMDDSPSAVTPSSGGELGAEQTEADVSLVALDPGCVIADSDDDSMPRVAGNLTADIEEFIVGMRRYGKNILGTELQENDANAFRWVFSHWNTFLQQVQGIPDTSAIISSDINKDINMFILWHEVQQGEQWTEDNKEWTKRWLPPWNMFLRARAGQTLVTRWNVYLTIVGFIFYIVDLVSDIGTSMYYAANGQWWRAMGTLTIVYGAVIIHTVVKWLNNRIHCTAAAACLRYVASLLVNWSDLEDYGALYRIEWKMCKSPACSAHLIPEWHQRMVRVVYLKYMEGVWEACPQAILQLCLLVPDLYGHWTWTDYFRIAGACVSLCTAGAAPVNLEKFRRIMDHNDLPLSELVVLHVWAVPVTMSRLLSLALLLSVHLYWVLAGLALHLILRSVYWCRTVGVPRILRNVIEICLDTLRFCMTPFDVTGSVTYRRVCHAVHYLVNTAMMVVWVLGTSLVCAHPVL